MVDLVIDKLKNGETGYYILKDGKIVYENKSGTSRQMLELFSENKEIFENSFFLGGIIGKVVAAVLIAGGVGQVYAYNISKKAVSFLTANDINFKYENEIETIMNEDGTAPCPLEVAVSQLYEPTLCVEAARNTISILENNKK